jgi:hypothetical protein
LTALFDIHPLRNSIPKTVPAAAAFSLLLLLHLLEEEQLKTSNNDKAGFGEKECAYRNISSFTGLEPRLFIFSRECFGRDR